MLGSQVTPPGLGPGELAGSNPAISTMDVWCRGLTYLTVTEKIEGSNPFTSADHSKPVQGVVVFGLNDDNRLENLRIVCPNCNATLDTNGGKNIKNKLKQIYVDEVW